MTPMKKLTNEINLLKTEVAALKTRFALLIEANNLTMPHGPCGAGPPGASGKEE